MPRNVLYLSAIASLFAFAPAAYAADFMAEPMPEAGLAVGVQQETAVVEQDDSIVDIDINLGLFDDDEDQVAMAAEPMPPEAEPYLRAAPVE